MEPLAADDPRQLGDYRLLRQLGEGGMGRVYLGRTTGGRTVAVKVVRRDLAGDSEFRARFRQEVAAARRVGGTWTAPVLDADIEGGHLWVATGYVAGPALATAVREFGPLPEPAVRTLGVGLAEALAHVHGLGLVHRDVKPSNVLLTLDGPRLIDFGIARALDTATALTQSGQVIGSPGFMSPEQANGLPAGPASDVFSLGAVLAYAATGTMPFGSGVSAPVLLYRVLHEEPDLSGLDGPLHSLVRDCLAKDPSARPSPGRLRERLDGDGAAAARLGQGDWLPAALAAAVGRSAVQLLDLEGERDSGEAAAGAAAPAPRTAAGTRAPTGGRTVADAARAARAAEAAGAVPGGGAPGAPGFGPPVPPGFGPPTAGPVGPAGPYTPTPVPTPVPMPSTGATGPGYGPYPPRPRGRRGYGALAAVLAVVLLLGGGYLLIERLRGNDGKAAASNPGQSAPAGGRTASAAPASKNPGPTGGGSDPASDSPAPSAAPTDPGQGIIPAKFLGTWVGERKAANGDVTTVTLTIVQSAPSEEKSRIRAETPSTGTWCEGAWTLSDANESQVSYASRETGSSPGDTCITNRSIYRLITAPSDGTLHYSPDLLKPEEYMVLQRRG
ncbi:protein kinase [Kitasatospora sp. RG8]|uniref:serine/threonine-protein kinase n=1 Tax=Kitasatospora sp. RG8 TaxID=2820815 RepID=UPI001ADF1140|nr:serine/threonine-protein kinase [Kitasatospora sp. RG8]MBP0452247.1 protein kinase [Kitasatospora sp. RG8]